MVVEHNEGATPDHPETAFPLPLRILRLPGGVEVHQMGEASQGIFKFLSKETRLLIIYTGGTMRMKPDA